MKALRSGRISSLLAVASLLLLCGAVLASAPRSKPKVKPPARPKPALVAKAPAGPPAPESVFLRYLWTEARSLSYRSVLALQIATYLPGHAEELSGKTLLLVGGKRDGMAPMDKHLDPLAKALQERNAPRFTEAVFDTDHNYSDHRIALARAMTSWLNEKCLAPRVPQSQPHPTGAVPTPPAPASAP